MKLLQTFAIAALALATAGFVQAQTVIRIVGSNGDRTATQTAISKLLASNWNYHGLQGPATSATLSVATGSNFGAWSGTFNGQPVIIKTSYSGALAGIAAVAGKTPQRFVVSNGVGTGNLPNPLTGTQLGTDYELGVADFGFSTNFQSTSPFLGEFEGVTYSPVIEEIVGVSPLGFYASPGFPVEHANITTQIAQLLYTSGAVPLSLFTGNHTVDQNKIVYAIGRNTDAGQRFGAYTEVGLGTSTAVRVWQPTITGQTTDAGSGITYGGTVVSHRLWQAETVSDIFSPEGNSGFNSGANLAVVLTALLGSDAYKGKFTQGTTTQFLYPNATAGYYIGYVTPGDANNRVLGANGVIPPQFRGVALKYNGVELTNDNVKSGRYTAWLYNRILKPQTGLSGLQLQFADALKTQIATVDAPFGGGIFDDANFKVQRFTDGGLVVPKE